MKTTPRPGLRERIAQGFTLVEDAVYLSLALLRKQPPIRAERAM